MAYTNNDGADPTKPDGASTAANTIDTELQKVKLAYNERLADAFGGDWSVSTEVDVTKVGDAVTFNGAAKQANQPVAALGNISGATALDFDVRGNYITATLTGNVTITVSNMRVGTTYVLIITQDATGGRSIGWPAGVRWPGGATPTPVTTANRVTVYTLTPYSSTILLGSMPGTNYNVS